MSDPKAFSILNFKFVAGKLTSHTTEPVAGTTQSGPVAEIPPEFVL
jgi:hypothetical protein